MFLRRLMPSTAPARSRPAAAIGALCLCALSGCGDSDGRSHNVVLIVLDTVRADHLSCYGYPRPTTPELDAFAAGADRYVTARSTAPWTLPSHASLFTGKPAWQHGADARKLPGGSVADAVPLAPDETTLAEALAGAGYDTGAFVANKGYVNPRMGLDQGFAHFMNERYPAPQMSEQALTWLSGRNPERPWFLFVNYMDAHRPYNTEPLPPERASQLPRPPAPGEPDAVASLDALYLHVFQRDEAPPPEMVQRVVDHYDLALANLDRGLGALFAELRARGQFDDALIVVTSDHGEFFGEHDLVEHSKDVYEQVLRVPLLVKRPGQTRGRVLPTPISLSDVARLVLDEASPTAAREQRDGFRGSAGGPGHLAQARYARQRDLTAPWKGRFERERDALYVENYKLIRSSDGKHELYDLESDPQERENLIAQRAAEAATLMARLQRELAKSGRGGAASLPELTGAELKALEAELRKLGYLGDERQAEPDSSAPASGSDASRQPQR